jgi:hypothetical protein
MAQNLSGDLTHHEIAWLSANALVNAVYSTFYFIWADVRLGRGRWYPTACLRQGPPAADPAAEETKPVQAL